MKLTIVGPERRADGSYQVGLVFREHVGYGACHWRALKARRKDAAEREVPEAIADLLEENARMIEERVAHLQFVVGELYEEATKQRSKRRLAY